MSRRFNLSAPLIVSVAALAVIVLLVINQGPPLLLAALGPTGGDADPQATLANLVDGHHDDFQVYQDRFNGRSFFFKPPPWPQPRRVAPPPPPPVDRTPAPVATPDPGPVTPRVSPDYTGPKILFVVGDSVWFESDRSTNLTSFEVSVGQEKDGIRVIETSLPWSVRLGYKGGEYDVPIFERVDLFEGGTPAATAASKPRFPGLVDASNTTSREEREAADDEDAGAEDPDEASEDAAEVASSGDGASTEPTATDENDTAVPADAAVAEATGGPATVPTDTEGSTPADASPLATTLLVDPNAAKAGSEPLMGPPTRDESTSTAAAETKTDVAGPDASETESPATATASAPADAATEKPKTEKPAASGDTATPTPAVAPPARPAPKKRPSSGRPAPEQRQGGRPAPEQQSPAKPTGAGDSGKPGKTGESDSSDTGSKSSEEPSNADPGKE